MTDVIFSYKKTHFQEHCVLLFLQKQNDTSMYCNVGSTDLKVRVALGLLIIVLGFYFSSWLFVLGWIPIITGLGEFCPLYSVFGINTTKEKKKFWA